LTPIIFNQTLWQTNFFTKSVFLWKIQRQNFFAKTNIRFEFLDPDYLRSNFLRNDFFVKKYFFSKKKSNEKFFLKTNIRFETLDPDYLIGSWQTLHNIKFSNGEFWLAWDRQTDRQTFMTFLSAIFRDITLSFRKENLNSFYLY